MTNLKLNKRLMQPTALFFAFMVFVGVIYATSNVAEWTWTGKVAGVVIGHYTDETCAIPVAAYESPSALNGDTCTTWVQNKGTVSVTLTIVVENDQNPWIVATYNYENAEIMPGSGLWIEWTLEIDPGYEGETFSLAITITASAA